MFDTAKLRIDNFTTTLTLTDGTSPPEFLNVIGDKGPDQWTDLAGYAQRAADKLLAEGGYTRVGDWTYDASRDQYIATIAQV